MSRILLRDLQPGQNYAIQLRRNDDGAVSEWSRRVIIETTNDAVAPSPPTNVSWTSEGPAFKASWTAPTTNGDGTPLHDLSHYEIILSDGVQNVAIRTTDVSYVLSFEANRAAFGTPKGTVYFQVSAVDRVGNHSPWTPEEVAINPKPDAPASLTAVEMQDAIALSWAAVDDADLAGYRVYVSTDGINGSYVQVTGINGTSVIHQTSQFLTDHYYRVHAIDVFGTESDPIVSAPVRPKSAFNLDTEPPATPTGLTANLSTDERTFRTIALVGWSAHPDTDGDLDGFKIRYRPDGTTDEWAYSNIGDEATTGATIYGLSSVDYEFQISAYDSQGNDSAWSAPVVAAVPAATTPPQVTEVGAVGDNQSISVAWTSLGDDVQFYIVQIDTDATFLSPEQSPEVYGNSHTFSPLTASTDYYVRVRARSHAGTYGPYSAIFGPVNSGTSEVDLTPIEGRLDDLEGDVALLPTDEDIAAAKKITTGAGNKTFHYPLVWGTSGNGIPGSIVIRTPITFDNYMTRIRFQGYNYNGGNGIEIDATVGFYAYSSGTFPQVAQTSSGDLPITVTLAKDASQQVVLILDNPSGIWHYTKLAIVDMVMGQATPPDSFADGWTAAIETDLTPYTIEGIPPRRDINETNSLVSDWNFTGTTEIDGGAIRADTVDAIVISAGSTFTQDLNVKSLFILGDADTEGSFASYDYVSSGGSTGFAMSSQGLVINDGTIDAKTLRGNSAFVNRLLIGAGGSIESDNYVAGVSGFLIDEANIEIVDGTVHAETIKAGVLSSTASAVDADGDVIAGLPAWSINLTGAAQFGDLLVRGTAVIGTGSETSQVKSYNYTAGLEGWIIRSDGYAEFRNLAVNSIGIGAFDQPVQSAISTKFIDFMEAGEYWEDHADDAGIKYTSGNFNPATDAELDASGAYSARAMLTLTNDTAVRRKNIGVQRGMAFEPELLYKITARVRQLTAASTNMMVNPSFEWTLGTDVADYWEKFGNTTTLPTYSQSTDVVNSGSHAQRIAGTIGWDNQFFGVKTEHISNPITIQGGSKFTISYYVNAEVNSNSFEYVVGMEELDETEMSIGEVSATPVASSAGWVRVSATLTASPTASFIRPFLKIYSTSTIDIWASMVIDDAMVTQGDQLLPYFDGNSLYAAWSGDTNGSPSVETHTSKFRIGVLGFDDNGNLCAADGSSNADPSYHYMVAADAIEELPTFDGVESESAGWLTYSGYIYGRGIAETGGSGEARDQYAPAPVHHNVRFIVPFVEMNINDNGIDAGYVGQLDMFSIEASDANAPTVMSTGGTGGKSIKINALEGEEIDHAIRFISGSVDEIMPGVIAQFFDGDDNNASSLLISPPVESDAQIEYSATGLSLRGRSANYLNNSGFERSPITYHGWKNVTISQTDLAYRDEYGNYAMEAKTTAGAMASGDPQSRIVFRISLTDNPELFNATTFTVSVWTMAEVGWVDTPMGFRLGVWGNGGPFAGYEFPDATASITNDPTQVIYGDGVWRRYHYTVTLPDFIPEDATELDVCFGWHVTSDNNTRYFDDMQLEAGELSDYKPTSAANARFNGDGPVFASGSIVISRDYSSTEQVMTVDQTSDGKLSQPGLFIEKAGHLAAIRNLTYLDGSGRTRSHVNIQSLTVDGNERVSPYILIFDENDEVAPNRLRITNRDGQGIVEFGDNYDPGNATANAAGRDMKVFGSITANGNPRWTTITDFKWNWTQRLQGYTMAGYKSNGMVYLRGSLVNTTTGTGSGKGEGSDIFQLPPSLRPPVPVEFWAGTFFIGDARPTPVLLWIRADGVCESTHGSYGDYLFFDNVSFAIGPDNPVTEPPPGSDPGTNPTKDTTPPANPGAPSLSPYSSGTSKGAYTVRWTNPGTGDYAKTRIVWRSDRDPNGPSDGNVIVVGGGPNKSMSKRITGLPVNKTIRVRLYGVDDDGNVNQSGSGVSRRYLLRSPITIRAKETKSWRDGYGGMWRNDGDEVYQGEWTGNDNHRGLWFYGNDVYEQLNKGGEARRPTRMKMYLRRTGSGGIYGDVGINLGAHDYNFRPHKKPEWKATDTNRVFLKTGEGRTITIPSAWYNNFQNGGYRGLGIGANNRDYAILFGRNGNRDSGKLTIWHKG